MTGVELDQTALALKIGETATLKATVVPSDATNQTVAFSTSDMAIATVTPVIGKVTAVAAGTTTITVATVDGAKTASCEVTVTEA
ncbi:Ig-like domain-containing protein [Loigolactobacillus coryniformis]|uniref:Ig domain-containing protein n=1 Tax=Loigolactobacillus binensis TaxID=2559922 RepID=A0ABW3EC80_9LACO|nr:MULTISPECIES: Ig-like domain-containing protein [Loigolactobacillus]KRK85510.1 Ig domain-containing protein group 2 domain-containing protein [Loigolactobacillus coryniformis subsp. torquens DSM 20004 = KCTC 3535]MCL5457616.1 Ig-like domain-containing protein [Loigolactobacillus coryniformis]MDN5953016.1 Ig-like domain-containing protein [Loigolactobacillus coryniformis]